MRSSLGPKITNSPEYQPNFCRVTIGGIKSGKTRIFILKVREFLQTKGKSWFLV